MALGENENKIQYTVTTSDDTFDFPYKYWETDNIVVTKLASGVESNPTFTITPTNGDSDNGGTVVLDTAVSSCTITIERIVPYESEADYKRGALSPTSLTENFDKQTAMSQQLAEADSRTLKAPTSDPAGLSYEIETVDQRKNKTLGFDESGNLTSISPVASGTVYADDTTVKLTTGNILGVKDLGIDTAQLAADAVETAILELYKIMTNSNFYFDITYKKNFTPTDVAERLDAYAKVVQDIEVRGKGKEYLLIETFRLLLPKLTQEELEEIATSHILEMRQLEDVGKQIEDMNKIVEPVEE